MHLFSLNNLTIQEIMSIVKDASVFDFAKKNTTATNNLILGLLFFEPSTRTKFSFEVAAQKLGIKSISFTGDKTTSLVKGETLYDTVKTFENLGVDALVIRHFKKEYYKELQNIKIPIISGGDGMSDHPTQSLLDLVTIYQKFNKFKDLKITFLGDVKHSRVANSNIAVMKRLGMKISMVGPKEFRIANLNVISLQEAIKESDVLIALRVQLERHKKTSINLVEYNKKFGLNLENIAHKKNGSIILHPGPINWGIELDSKLIDHPDLRINQQVANGLLVRGVLLQKILLCK